MSHSRRIALALVIVLFGGCKALSHIDKPMAPLPTGQIDEAPPLHTGGPGPTRPVNVFAPQPGNATAGAVAAGIGIATMGAGVVRTIESCAQPHASVVCLRGSVPAGEDPDAGP